MQLQMDQFLKLHQLLDDQSMLQGCFKQNEAFILYLSFKCSNVEDIKSKVLTRLFGKSEDQIRKLENSDFFKNSLKKMKKRYNKQKNKIKEASLTYSADDLDLSQYIVVKHILRTIAFKRKNQLNIQLMQFELKAGKDLHLCRLFKISKSFDWISFLIYVIMKNDQDNLTLLSRLLVIPPQKLSQFYHERRKAVNKILNQDTNKYRRLLYYFQKQNQRQSIQNQIQRTLVREAVKKYSEKRAKKCRKELNSDTLLGQARHSKLSGNFQLKSGIREEQKIRMGGICLAIDECNFEDQAIQIQDKDKDNEELPAQQKQDQIYYSDQESIQISLGQNSMRKDFFQNEPDSFWLDFSPSDLQTTSFNAQQQNKTQNKSVLIQKGQEGLYRIQTQCNLGQQGQKLSKRFKQVQESLQQTRYIDLSQSQEQVQGLQSCSDGHQAEGVQKTSFHGVTQRYSYEDQVILYLLYRLNGHNGMRGALAQTILKRPSQQLLQYFLTMNVQQRSQQLVQTLLNYPQLLQFQKNVHMLVLIDRLREKLQLMEEMETQQQGEESVNTAFPGKKTDQFEQEQIKEVEWWKVI